MGPLAGGGQKFRQRLGMHNGHLWLAVFKVVAIVGGMRKWIYGYSDGPDFGGAEKCRDEFRRIRKQDQDASASGDALIAQGISDTIGKRREFAISNFAGFTNDRDALRMPPGRLIQKMLRDV